MFARIPPTKSLRECNLETSLLNVSIFALDKKYIIINPLDLNIIILTKTR
jgi:hypothetical protein